ncbi:DUF3572 family protein [Sphingomonas xanthus]|uniref:DUF3572 family protein n=1 Tax=Sphingomonas xanthus TaxID=2594473 RepID=A0A516IRT4_9SPHN|nr:DUF3572 family protein [Sphingomonas xanthus]QDP19623.1 DUF3572 family protein [Sphingomonas xanthus]
MLSHHTNRPLVDAEALALAALAATLSDERRAVRFLDITGIDADGLRERVGAGDSGLLAAVLMFLENHEPDLLAVAGTMGVAPSDLVAARSQLER